MFVYIVVDREGRIDKVFDSANKAFNYIDEVDPLWEKFKHDDDDRYNVICMEIK